MVHENIIIKNNSRAFDLWKNPPARIVRKYYLFDLTNPKEVEAGTEKPKLIERGPYTYIEKWEKRNIEFLGLEIVKFTPVITLYFDQNLSNGNESDIITLPNIPALGLISSSKTDDSASGMVDFIFSMMSSRLFIQRTVKQLMSGYEDDLLEMAQMYYPDKVKSNSFSMLYNRNGTEYQEFSIMTGNKNYMDKGKIVEWNGNKKLDFWFNENANTIKGTDGTMYAPFLTRDTKLFAFNSDMCRSLNLEYKEDKKIHGIDTFKFHFPQDLFNKSKSLHDGFCLDDCHEGLQSIKKCYGGMDSYISKPHFLDANKTFVTNLNGISPEIDKHETSLYFEPLTSVPILGNIRLQISFKIPRNKNINLIKNVNPVIMPILWFDEELNLEDKVKEEISYVSWLSNFVLNSLIIGCYLGILCIFFVLLLWIKMNFQKILSKLNVIYSL